MHGGSALHITIHAGIGENLRRNRVKLFLYEITREQLFGGFVNNEQLTINS